VERRGDVDGEDVGVSAADRLIVNGDEAVDAGVEEVAVLDALGANGSGSRRMPPESTQ
jgi:hypothetical protein